MFAEKEFLKFLQSYASILYLRLPTYFQMILRGKEIEHHNIVTDMMLKKEVTYRPVAPNGHPKDSNVNNYEPMLFLNPKIFLQLISDLFGADGS